RSRTFTAAWSLPPSTSTWSPAGCGGLEETDDRKSVRKERPADQRRLRREDVVEHPVEEPRRQHQRILPCAAGPTAREPSDRGERKEKRVVVAQPNRSERCRPGDALELARRVAAKVMRRPVVRRIEPLVRRHRDDHDALRREPLARRAQRVRIALDVLEDV